MPQSLTSSFPPVYLLEVLSSPNGPTEECDNFAKLELAVERALLDLLATTAVPFEVDVSFDEEGEIEGIGFLNEAGELLALISVYHLDRDVEQASDPDLAAACRGDKRGLQAALNRIVRA